MFKKIYICADVMKCELKSDIETPEFPAYSVQKQ